MDKFRWNVVLAGARPGMTQALAGLLDQFDDVSPCAPDVIDLTARATHNGNSVILLDADGDPEQVLAALATARSHAPGAPVISLHVDPEGPAPSGMTEAARLSKDVSPEDLVHAIRTVHDGDRSSYLGAERPAGRRADAPRVANLTEREHQVLELLLTGSPNAGIAAALQISPHTVRSHVRSLIVKLGCRDRFDVVTSVRQHGFAAFTSHAGR